MVGKRFNFSIKTRACTVTFDPSLPIDHFIAFRKLDEIKRANELNSTIFALFIDQERMALGRKVVIAPASTFLDQGCTCDEILQQFNSRGKEASSRWLVFRIICSPPERIKEAVKLLQRVLSLQRSKKPDVLLNTFAYLQLLLCHLAKCCDCGKGRTTSLKESHVFIPYLSAKRPGNPREPDLFCKTLTYNGMDEMKFVRTKVGHENRGKITSTRGANEDLLFKLSERLPKGKSIAKPQQSGFIYILQSSETPGLLKIGCSEDQPEIRRKDWGRCYPKIRLVAKTNKVPFVHRVEALIHAELLAQRRVHLCTRCQRAGQPPTEHSEWFEINQEIAFQVVLRWAKWMASRPYEIETRSLKNLWKLRVAKAWRSGLVPAVDHLTSTRETWESFTGLRRPKGPEKDDCGIIRLKRCTWEDSPFDT